MKNEMVMNYKIYYILAFIPFFIFSCSFSGVRGDGNVINEGRDVGSFSKIDISGNYDVEIIAGKEPSVEVVAEGNLLKLIRTRVKKKTLYISSKKNLRPTDEMLIKISVEELNEIECSGVNDIVAENISAERFKIDLSGAGSIELYGKAAQLYIEISGAADIEAKDFIADDVVIEVSGAANAEVYAAKSVDAEVSGAGYIELYGDAKKVKTDISGAGSLVRK